MQSPPVPELPLALYEAASKGLWPPVKAWLEGPDGDIDLTEGEHRATLLIGAALHGKVSIVDSLLQRGADVHPSSKQGCTALIAAAARGHARVLERLLLFRPDLSAVFSTTRGDKYTALQLAQRNLP
jgi:ankyrin repeat protein